MTLAIRNAPDTLCANAADCKRLAKDVDSAWLRFAPDARSPGVDLEALALDAVAFTLALTSEPADDAGNLAMVGDVRPFLVCDGPLDDSSNPAAAYAALREYLFQRRVKS